MEEIRTQAEKHIEADEDLADRLEAEHQPLISQEGLKRGNGILDPTQSDDNIQSFTPLKVKMIQILREVYHTQLLKFLKTTNGRTIGRRQDKWCKFHKAHNHSTEECQTLL
ncbi:hypothetical protein CR513_43944, partial [Mucuna pruriens]